MRARSERSSVSGQVTSSHVPFGFIFSWSIILSGSNGPAAADKTRQKPGAMARLARAILLFMMLPPSPYGRSLSGLGHTLALGCGRDGLKPDDFPLRIEVPMIFSRDHLP